MEKDHEKNRRTKIPERIQTKTASQSQKATIPTKVHGGIPKKTSS